MKTKGWMSRAFTVGYWIALPFLALLALGMAVVLLKGEATAALDWRTWGATFVAFVAPFLVAWRIWIHRRARRRYAETQVVGEFD